MTFQTVVSFPFRLSGAKASGPPNRGLKMKMIESSTEVSQAQLNVHVGQSRVHNRGGLNRAQTTQPAKKGCAPNGVCSHPWPS